PRVSSTALGAATCRLIEQYEPDRTRLFDDAVVKDLVGPLIWVSLRSARLRAYTSQQTDAIMPGIYGVQVCRTRRIDEAVEQALAQGIEQVLILGAGLDSRPYRLAGIDRVQVFELDLPAVHATKQARIRRCFGRLPSHVTFIPIDFDTKHLETVLM